MRDDSVSDVEVPAMTDEERVLRKARDLIRDPAHWIQGCLAQTKHGLNTEPCNDNADKWCVNGAIIRASRGFDHSFNAIRAVNKACRLYGPDGPFYAHILNDTRTHADVMALLDRAIASYR